MEIEFISNKRFCTLNNTDREHLKQSSLNFIIKENYKETHYIHEREMDKALNELTRILKDYKTRNSKNSLSVYINPDTYTEIIKAYPVSNVYTFIDNTHIEDSSVELF